MSDGQGENFSHLKGCGVCVYVDMNVACTMCVDVGVHMHD